MNQRDDYNHELISAFLDGELTPDERAHVEQLVEHSPEHRQMLEDLQAVIAGIKELPGRHLGGDFSHRVISLGRQSQSGAPNRKAPGTMPQGALPQGAMPHRVLRLPRLGNWPAIAGLTAVAATAALLVLFFGSPSPHPIERSSGAQIAQRPPSDRVSSAAAALRRGARTDANASPGTLSPVPSLPEASQPASIAGRSTLEPSAVVAEPSLSASPPSPDSAASPENLPSSAPIAVVADGMNNDQTGAAADVRDILEPGSTDREPPASTSRTPFAGTTQLLLVIDVAMTPQGMQQGAFENALADHQVIVEGNVPVDPTLENALLASRYFDPIQTPPGQESTAHTDLALVYVSARAGHLDEIWRTMQSHASEFAAVSLDLAFMPDDQTLFRNLRQAVERPAGDAGPGAGTKLRERRAAAHRLALSPSWRGTPAHKLKGLAELTGMVPDWMLGGEGARKEGAAHNGPPPRLAQLPLLSDARLREDVDAEALFVVHLGRRPQP
ncbi:MAG: anti-sigma factor family protein [Pirellulaceae bacterium]